MKLKNVVNLFILFIITGVVLYFSLKDNFNLVVDTIKNIKIEYIVLAVIIFIGSIFFRSLVVYFMTKGYDKKYKFKKAFRMETEVNFFSGITPFATGGQPYELYRLNKDGIDAMDATNICIQNFIIYQIVLVLLGLAAIIYNYYTGIFAELSFIKGFVVLGFGVNFLVIVTLLVITFCKNIKVSFMKFILNFLIKIRTVKNKEKALDKFSTYLNDFDAGAKVLFKNPKKFILLLIFSAVSLCLLYSIPLVIITGVSSTYDVGLINTIAASAYVMLVGAFVPIPGGSGGLEYAFVNFFGTFISGSKINAIMLVWRIITFYFAMILGAIVLGLRKKA